ncbi:two-component system sensor histidine kinase RppB [Dapis sp. BLCC M172]|uniref:two-component system sensor histidine kinase RppB n=1 Tax=Dapis sp. BLCC M172 TaxID=2975281 RepID=UPI003CEC3EC6
MNSHQLFRHSRLRLALWYALVMGVILSLSGFGMYRALVQAKWQALEQEIESIAGTLHDSLEPMLPISEDPTLVLQQIFPELCVVGQPCNTNPTLIQRHTIGISDRQTYYIRLFDNRGNLLAFSPNQPTKLTQTLHSVSWQTLQSPNGIRYRQFTIILHGATAHQEFNSSNSASSWGYLQIGRTLESFDVEVKQFQWILAFWFPIALSGVGISSWWLSGLAMQPIYESYQQQKEFTANAAHELRSPLASLLATVEAILRIPQSNPQNIKTMLQTVERQGRRLSNLIADLLFLTSLEHNLSSPQLFQPCCLNDLISDLTEEFLELATFAKIDLISQIPDGEIYVLGNEPQLYRLVSNLITNAIHYTPNGGQVVVSLTARDCTAFITVKDTGIGILPSEQARIFERFYRVDSHRDRKTGGTGLGLAIARAISHHHQGDITVKSQLGKGSLFTIHLPCISQTSG